MTTREELAKSLNAAANLQNKDLDGATYLESTWKDLILMQYIRVQNDKEYINATINELEFYLSIKDDLQK